MLYPIYVHKDQDSSYGLTFLDFEAFVRLTICSAWRKKP